MAKSNNVAGNDVNSATNTKQGEQGVRRVLYNNWVDPKFSHFPVTKTVVDC